MSAFDFKDEHNPYAATTRTEATSLPPQGSKLHNVHGYYRSARGLATITMILFGLALLCLAGALVLNIEMLGLLYQFQATGIRTPRMFTLPDELVMAMFIYIPIALIAYLLLACWIYRVNKNVHVMGMKYVDNTPGWSVGWWFVPIANLWKPYAALAETWRASLPGYDRTSWTQAVTPKILLIWWLVAWTATILSQISTKLADQAEQVEEFISAMQFSLAGIVVNILAFVLLIACVHLLTNDQMAKHDQLLSQPDPDDEQADFSFLDGGN